MKTKIDPLPVKKVKEQKIHCSIRLTPKTKAMLIQKHGSLQYAIEYLIAKIYSKEN